jgi:putative membrane-bound dehydrogenase-like protein
MRLAKTLGLLPFLTLPLAAQQPMAKGNSVNQAAAKMTVPAGFAVDLLAGEPDIVQPIALCIDARGRLWVAEGLTYPQRAPDGQGKDRIVILEDADGDGSYETRKVFAEGLNLVSGLETGFGGVFVGAAPYLMFLADADGDDKPDGPPEVLLDGWGYQDTHETLNSFIWGPDGWLYGCHGVFTHSRVGKPGTADEARVPINAGVWRYHPVKRDFEVFAHGTSNPWGLDFNDHGEAFVEACVIPHLWHIIPGGYYQRQAGSHFNPHIYDPLETIADHRHWVGKIGDHAHWGHENAISKDVSDAGGGHAHSGFTICLSDAFPAEMRGSALFFNIHGHRMNRDLLVPRGSGYVGKHAPDLMLSNDEWFLGVAIESGPGGAVFFTDWHDETSCHRTDPLRWNRGNGRVYRLRHGAVKPWKGDISQLPDLELAKLQAGRDEWMLRTARRVLQERAAAGKEISYEAIAFLLETARDHQDPTRRLRAWWCLNACGMLIRKDVPAADADPAVRGWAVRFAAPGEQGEGRDHWIDFAAKEQSPVVLLSLCSALQKLPPPLAIEVAAVLAPKLTADDPNLTRMFWFGFEALVPLDEKRAVAIAAGSPDGRLLAWTARRVSSFGPLLSAHADGRVDAPRLLDALAVRMEARPDEKLGDAGMTLLSALHDGGDAALKAKADALLLRAGGREAAGRLWPKLEDRQAAAGERLEALKLLTPLLESRDDERLAKLTDDPALRVAVLAARPVLLDHPAADDRVAGFSAEEKAAVCRLAAREGKAGRLLGWLAAMKIKPRDVPADAVARLREVRDPSLQKRIVELWGEPSADQAARRELIAGWRAKLTPEVLAAADAGKGRALYERTCAACHRLFGEGGEIGPELTGGERGSLDHWLDNILDPNALIGEGYALHQIEKHDGSLVSGMLAAENDDELVLRMVGVETRVAKKDVKSNKPLGVSMMPEGLLNGLSDEEVRDLVGYLMAPAQVGRK